jgi:hypothetical protein
MNFVRIFIGRWSVPLFATAADTPPTMNLPFRSGSVAVLDSLLSGRSEDEVGRFLSDHDRWRVGVSAYLERHDG